MNALYSNRGWLKVNPAVHVLSDPNRTGTTSSGGADGSKMKAGRNASCTLRLRWYDADACTSGKTVAHASRTRCRAIRNPCSATAMSRLLASASCRASSRDTGSAPCARAAVGPTHPATSTTAPARYIHPTRRIIVGTYASCSRRSNRIGARGVNPCSMSGANRRYNWIGESGNPSQPHARSAKS